MSGAQAAPALRLGVIGAGRHADDLAALHPWGYPFVGGHVQVSACAPERPGGEPAAALARACGARMHSSAGGLIAAGGIDAVLLLAPVARRAGLARAALDAGCAVLCPVPLTASPAEFDALAGSLAARASPAVVLADGALARTPAGRGALDLLASGAPGRIESVWAGVRRPAGSETELHGGLDATAWDVLDFVLACIASPVARVFAHRACLFAAHGAPDTLVAIARCADGTVISFEASACLPAGLAAPPAGSVEIELIGARETLRLEPYETAVSVVVGEALTGVARRDWIEAPVAGMLRALAAAMQAPQHAQAVLAHQRRLVAFAAALQASIESGDAVEVAPP